jgi:rhodanese-related sulfurtransferase
MYFENLSVRLVLRIKQLCVSLLCSLFLWLPCTYGQPVSDFDKMLNGLYRNTVDLVNAETLIEMQQNQSLFLLDTRELEEFEVSHLSSAIFVGYNNFSIENLDNIPKDAIIVVYCSVGYRSEIIGKQLLDSGFSAVLNLRGGIFDWVGKGYPVVNSDSKAVLKVHPYNKKWSKWVKNCEIAYE